MNRPEGIIKYLGRMQLSDDILVVDPSAPCDIVLNERVQEGACVLAVNVLRFAVDDRPDKEWHVFQVMNLRSHSCPELLREKEGVCEVLYIEDECFVSSPQRQIRNGFRQLFIQLETKLSI